MAAQLKSTVFVKDPDTNQTIELAPGTLPEPRLAALVTNPAAWVDGKLPRLRTNKAETEKDPEDDNASGDDPDDASGNGSDPGPDAADPGDDPDDKPAPRATAKKTTSRRQSSSQ
ncbi:hypothetical protein [Streptomyces sp. WAC08241]|uniref:hypothetical protein n=1 Tax=Streptomyces sp. WAC08241 TaxID=2487421 RepID=UPI000F7A3271|nr:hypothetical protein [Streptomyces sp. WAC08241]RSS43818.1 hypothetical protein EF906_08700 [Streptomyces sp. WAC08241]